VCTVLLFIAAGVLAIVRPQEALAGEPDTRPADTGSLASVCGEPERHLDLPDAVAQALNLQPRLIIAQAQEAVSRSQLKAATAAFLPQIDLSAIEERYVPTNASQPVVVVDNTVLGGAQTKTAYGSLSLQWNLWNSGQDVAAYHGAQAGIRAATYGVDEQLDKTLMDVLQAYADLYAAEITARNDGANAAGLETIQARSEKRYARGYGTEVAVGQARVAALDAAQTLNQACRDLSDKSATLAEAVGLELAPPQALIVGSLPKPLLDLLADGAVADLIDSSPAAAEAREDVVAAESKLHRALGEFGPSISLAVRRDYLGQNTDSFGRANHLIAPADYLIALEFQQPLFPLGSQGADVDKARAELRKAQASYRQARLEVQTKLAAALSARRAAERSYMAAESSLADAEQVLELTKAQYLAGRKDLDSVDHARMDRDTAEAELEKLASARALAQWRAARALLPRQFPTALMHQLHLDIEISEPVRDDPKKAPDELGK
jgi:outer membrane protein TolC